MKKASIILIGIFLFTSCSVTKKLERQLVGKFAVEMLKSSKNEQVGDTYGNLLKELLKNSYIQFNKDYSYEMNIAGKKFDGTWQFSEDGKNILTNNKEIHFQIVEFTETGLLLKYFNKNDAVVMVLKKINE